MNHATNMPTLAGMKTVAHSSSTSKSKGSYEEPSGNIFAELGVVVSKCVGQKFFLSSDHNVVKVQEQWDHSHQQPGGVQHHSSARQSHEQKAAVEGIARVLIDSGARKAPYRYKILARPDLRFIQVSRVHMNKVRVRREIPRFFQLLHSTNVDDIDDRSESGEQGASKYAGYTHGWQERETPASRPPMEESKERTSGGSKRREDRYVGLKVDGPTDGEHLLPFGTHVHTCSC
jgi:hypothetical protein